MRDVIEFLKERRAIEERWLQADRTCVENSQSAAWQRMAENRIPQRQSLIDQIDDAIEILEEEL